MKILKYHRHSDDEMPRVLREGCDACKRKFDNETSLCGFCGHEVANKIYLAKGSTHVDGRCRKSLREIKIPGRTVDKPLPYPTPRGPQLPEKAFKPIDWYYAS